MYTKTNDDIISELSSVSHLNMHFTFRGARESIISLGVSQPCELEGDGLGSGSVSDKVKFVLDMCRIAI